MAAFAAEIASSAQLSLSAIRGTMRRSLVAEVSAVLDIEVNAQAALLDSADFPVGVAASVEKRPPWFNGS